MWGRMLLPTELARNKRPQWLLLKAVEKFNKENLADTLNMEDLLDLGWFPDDNRGSGSYDFLNGSADELISEDMGDFEEADQLAFYFFLCTEVI